MNVTADRFYTDILKVLEPHRGWEPQSCVEVIESIIEQRDAAVAALAALEAKQPELKSMTCAEFAATARKP